MGLRRERRDDEDVDGEHAVHPGRLRIPAVPEQRLYARGYQPARDRRRSIEPCTSADTLLPPSIPTGTSSFTLTVNGSGFVSTSVVSWKGANRTTTFVSATQLRATILAGDRAAQGTADVTVATPAPGGGVSSPMAFTITPPPSISVSVTSARVGTSVTATLINGYGGAQDWLALAATSSPNSTYVQYIFIGTGVTTRTWTVTLPSTPGTYEFRLFLNNSYTRAATSPPITVTP